MRQPESHCRATAKWSWSAGPASAVRSGKSSDFAVARYNPNGSLDTSFSGDGKQTASFGESDVAKGVAIQADGKIVAVGNDCNGNPDTTCDFALARFSTPNGSLDTSFSGDGKQTADLGYVDIADATRVQEDGKIVAAASRHSKRRAALRARALQLNGTLDASFAGDGKEMTEFASTE